MTITVVTANLELTMNNSTVFKNVPRRVRCYSIKKPSVKYKCCQTCVFFKFSIAMYTFDNTAYSEVAVLKVSASAFLY